MKRSNSGKNSNRVRLFTGEMRLKLVALLVIVLLAFLGLSIRIYAIGRDNGEEYKKNIYSQQRYSSKELPFKRGDIVDRKGSKLAYSEKVYNLVVDAKELCSKEGIYLEPTLEAVKKFFPEVDVNGIRQYVKDKPNSRYKIFAKKLSYDEMKAFTDYEEEFKKAAKDKKKAEAGKKKKKGGDDKEPEDPDSLAGIWFEEDYKREYPYGSLACDVIGFTLGENSGYFGLEEYYNSTLNGVKGRQYGYMNEEGIVEQTIKPATDGNTIVSTIDTNIQSIVEKHILAFNEEHKNEVREGNGANNIGVIIMDPNNGEVLAMASYPTFDLNNPMDLSPFYSQEDMEGELGEDKEPEKEVALDNIWRNFCTQDTYEPGSTAKPFTVAAAIEEGAITGDESYTCGGALEVGGHTIHCHNRLGDGTLTVSQGIQKSCNVVLMDVAFALGKERWLKYNRLFNFGLKTNIDLAGEVNAKALVFDESMGQTDLAIGSFGQGFNVTMIQMACAYCSLINGGYYYEPHVVNKILNSEGATIEEINPRILKQTISEETSAKLRDMLRSVVMEGTEGTGYTARPAGYTMGGKTGTAEKIPRDKKNYVVSFCGYVPAENPQVLSYVVIDQPNVPTQDSARYATLLTNDIMTEVLPYMNIFMTEELTEEEMEELREKELTFSIDTSSVSVNEAGQLISLEDAMEQEAAVSENKPAITIEKEEASEEVSENKVNYDPSTGYPIDPNTGEVLDPQTLLPVAGGGSFMD